MVFFPLTGRIMTTSCPWKWEKNYLTSPVTSTEFLGPDLLFSGESEFSYGL